MILIQPFTRSASVKKETIYLCKKDNNRLVVLLGCGILEQGM